MPILPVVRVELLPAVVVVAEIFVLELRGIVEDLMALEIPQRLEGLRTLRADKALKTTKLLLETQRID
jgi:hypothetical protein